MTRIVVLAAGNGSRLRPLTDNLPKGLVNLLGKPIIQYQLDVFFKFDLTNVAIVTGHYANKFDKLGIKTYFNPLYQTTNMVESLLVARKFFENSNEDLIISYGDIVYQPDNFEKLINADGEIALMIDQDWKKLWSIRNENIMDDAETLRMGPNQKIYEIGKKPGSLEEIEGQYTGLIKIKAEKIRAVLNFYDALDKLDDYDGQSLSNMYMTTFIQRLIDSGWDVRASIVKSGWLEIDTVKDLILYEREKELGRLDRLWHAS